MHWSESLAHKVIERNPNKDEYVCATGISPSGSVHIGNFRDIATSYFVVKALRKLGKNARLMHSWDNFDRLRKIPVNVSEVADNMEQYIGYPCADIPNPFADEAGADTYASHFEKEFASALSAFGIQPDYRYQTDMYRSGKYTSEILLALKERGRIFDILDSFRTQDAQEGERDNYYPVSIYCPECKRDTTKITAFDDDTGIAHYVCKCGHSSDFNFHVEYNCKLAWKVDWAMRWRYEGVDFEPGGQDHASPAGSYQTSKLISEQIFGFEPPIFQGYGFIGLKGAVGKMSGSTGLNLTPAALLKIYEPELILWLYSKTEPLRTFDFCFDDGILRQYFEFDKMWEKVSGGSANELETAMIHNARIDGRELRTVPMSWLVQFGSVVNFNPRVLETVFTKIGTPYSPEDFSGRLELAKNWLEMCSPESVNRIHVGRNHAYFETLSDSQKREIAVLHGNLSENAYELDDLGTMLYAVPAVARGEEIADAKEKKALQTTFFKNVYQLLIGKANGPRLYLFLHALERAQYLHLLDFSHPIIAEESGRDPHGALLSDGAAPDCESADFGAMTVQPFKPQISFDAFTQSDLRVCEVVKASEIRKSNNCLKLTVNDGSGERVIVSGIAKDYSPDALIGRKVIVAANLAPVKITGVVSEGMLLAVSNDAGKTTVIFADAAIPNGAMLR
jgi:lysyl-tRNA synthetase class 1